MLGVMVTVDDPDWPGLLTVAAVAVTAMLGVTGVAVEVTVVVAEEAA